MASTTTNFCQSQIPFSSATLVDHRFEFQESDIWMISPSSSPGFRHIQPPNSSRKRSSLVSPSSLPLSIPDWSKIQNGEEDDYAVDNDDSSEEEEEDRVPPHEYAARQAARRSGMVVAYSLHQGTLKARDLRRLRNAIWKHTTGFQD